VETLKRSSKQNSAREQNFIDMDTCGWSIRKENMDYVGGFCIFLLVLQGFESIDHALYGRWFIEDPLLKLCKSTYLLETIHDKSH
jgi:hypothetical protein